MVLVVVVVVMVVALASVSARMVYFFRLEASNNKREPHLRATALTDRGVRHNDVFLEFGGCFRQNYVHFASHSAF